MKGTETERFHAKFRKKLQGGMNRKALQAALGLKDAEHFRKSYIQPALEAGLIEMTIPHKPRSKKQKYRLTEKGQKELVNRAGFSGDSVVCVPTYRIVRREAT
jgi:ATP-dependent DNA helicase RecG